MYEVTYNANLNLVTFMSKYTKHTHHESDLQSAEPLHIRLSPQSSIYLKSLNIKTKPGEGTDSL